MVLRMRHHTLMQNPSDQQAPAGATLWWAVLLLLLLPLALTGCATSADDQAVNCPRPGLMQHADRLVVFDNMAAPTRETVTVKAELAGYSYGCRPMPKKGAMEMHMTLSFAATRQPLAPELKGLTLPYFVAVLDPQGNIVERQRHKVRLVFGARDNSTADRIAKSPDTAARDQDHVIFVAAPTAAAAAGYRVTFGFELVPAQLRYNQGDSTLSLSTSSSQPRKG